MLFSVFLWNNIMVNAIVYVHGKGGSPAESEHYRRLFQKHGITDFEVIGFDYKSQTPWESKEEFRNFFREVKKKYGKVILIANSIGAFFSICSLNEEIIQKALLISPVVNMEKLIADMMKWANVSEEELFRKKEIATSFGETLSWNYLSWVRENTFSWNVPTEILYGENDNMQSLETVCGFAEKFGATVTVMKNGEHWFHTEKQMEFLDEWAIHSINKEK